MSVYAQRAQEEFTGKFKALRVKYHAVGQAYLFFFGAVLVDLSAGSRYPACFHPLRVTAAASAKLGGHRIFLHLIASHLISSHLISYYRIVSYRIVSAASCTLIA